jgi:hypothetical protein
MVNGTPKEEPSYMMYARDNVARRVPTSPDIVKRLLSVIDTLAAGEKVTDSSNVRDNPAPPPPSVLPPVTVSHIKWIDISYDDHGGVQGYSVTKCTCDTPWKHRP